MIAKMRVAIEKECAQMLEKKWLDVSRSIDMKSVLNNTATSLSTYVNSSIFEHSEISPKCLSY